MTDSQLAKLIAELRFMGVSIPDIYERITLVDNQITRIDFDSVNLLYFPHFPVTITSLPGLQRLSLRYNQLDTIPPEVFELENLIFLDVSHNQLEVFPKGVEQLINLQHLRMTHNKLRDSHSYFLLLPSSIQHLDLQNNLLEHLPLLEPYLNLTHLNLAENLIKFVDFQELPDNIYYVNLRSNLISLLEGLSDTELQKLNLYNNPLTLPVTANQIPFIFMDQRHHHNTNVEILHKRFHDRRFLDNYPPQFGLFYQGIPFSSVMVYGQPFVGKQSFIECYLKELFIPDSKLLISQNRYMNWEHYTFLYNYRNFQFWYPFDQDINNPEFRRGILNGFYYAGVILLMFDLSKPDSFQTVVTSVQQIDRLRSHNTPIIVIGNKRDLRVNPWRQEVATTLQSLRDRTARDLHYFETSAKTGEGISEVFEFIYSIFID